MGVVEQINRCIDAGSYAEAFRLASVAMAESGGDPRIMESMLHLTANLRSICMYMACKRMDGGAKYLALEALLREASAVTGQDMYGRIVRERQGAAQKTAFLEKSASDLK
ncbi:hypothetical protein ACFFJT_01305 [Dyella flava]|uniref:Uncharacterized protein n=1 Tax=Dyella flava TaxID=1920170 RepID=A0ABS2K1U9_9GAMM|nr:hypothetical protein [Dyella flava]MBM7125030.1 hypothetical protein [Dyella flava]GLQ52342.1 hypothetical protein GCM10010872_37910 [Dyella flava]